MSDWEKTKPKPKPQAPHPAWSGTTWTKTTVTFSKDIDIHAGTFFKTSSDSSGAEDEDDKDRDDDDEETPASPKPADAAAATAAAVFQPLLNPHFTYDPLPNTATPPADHIVIRKLTLHPGAPSDPITCQLWPSKVPLADNPDPAARGGFYLALSYSRSTESGRNRNRVRDPAVAILCNAQPLRVPGSLAAALRNVRHGTRPLAIWTDAICVNQADEAERSAMVAAYAFIFRQAAGVVAWLGDGDAYSDAAMALVRRMSTAWEQEAVSRRRHSGGLEALPERILDLVGVRHDTRAKRVERMRQLRDLLRRPWYRRMWAVLETACARRVWVRCGTEEMERKQFLRGFDFARLHGLLADGDGADSMRALTQLRSSIIDKPLYQLLDNFRSWPAADVRDKVFGLCALGRLDPNSALMRDVSGMGLVPDYVRGAADVFRHVTVATMCTSRSLDILSTVGQPRVTVGLPSWVPDWGAIGRPNLNVSRMNFFSASSGAQAHVRIHRKKLTLRGFCLDEVVDVELLVVERPPGRAGARGEPACQDQFALAQLDLFAVPSSSGRYITGEPHLDVYRQTLTQTYAIDMAELRARADNDNSFSHESFMHSFHNWFQQRAACRLYIRLRDQFPLGVLLCDPLGQSIIEHGLNSPKKAKRQAAAAAADTSTFTRYYRAERNLCLARTRKGYLAAVPEDTQVGDTVGIFQGGRMPLVMRKGGPDGGGSWRLVGDCYVHGVMKGEAYDEGLLEDFEFE